MKASSPPGWATSMRASSENSATASAADPSAKVTFLRSALRVPASVVAPSAPPIPQKSRAKRLSSPPIPTWRTTLEPLLARGEKEKPRLTSHGIGMLTRNGPHTAPCQTWRISWSSKASRRVLSSASMALGIITFPSPSWPVVLRAPVATTVVMVTEVASEASTGSRRTRVRPSTAATATTASSPRVPTATRCRSSPTA